MDDSGRIYDAEQVRKLAEMYGRTVEEQVKQQRLVDIPEEELSKVQAMNRRERRAWYAQRRREEKKRRRAERKADG